MQWLSFRIMQQNYFQMDLCTASKACDLIRTCSRQATGTVASVSANFVTSFVKIRKSYLLAKAN